ncbi:magnesium transporter [Candidatus Daviesbacteria bacterium]|nr:magnesium transporter [Candidatus Daviesbacteria bacterium]
MKLSHHDSLMKAELVSAKFWDLIKIRLPWLVVGLVGGLVASMVVSRFETSLQETIALAFFIPVIAYMSDAIGTQTETILIRALTNLKFDITKYVYRELLLGAVIGSVLGIVTGVFAYFLSASSRVGYVVGISLFISMTIAAVLACLTPLILRSFGKDPAVGSGPFTTAVQDVASLLIYFSVAILIL